MESTGHGVVELRVHIHGEFRVFYVAKFPEFVYILTAFQKKTEKTPSIELLRARRAYAEIKNYQIE